MNFSCLYNAYCDRINKKLMKIITRLPFQNSVLLKAMKYSVFLGGKRLRSCLVYITGEMFKVDITVLDVISSSIELIHSYSLIHDDLPCIDNDFFRRGKISCHVKYGENFALLAGDALQGLAFNILSSQNMKGISDAIRLKMIFELSSSIGPAGMCIGQTLDLEKENKKINIFELEEINLYKTAFLIRSSVRLAYLASSNFSKEILSILDEFSIAIGLFFQIQDDIFDLKNDSIKLKNKKNVIKNTYPLLIGLKKSKIKIEELCKKAFFALECLKKDFDTSKLELLTQFIVKRSK